jgi:hypothetical protein
LDALRLGVGPDRGLSDLQRRPLGRRPVVLSATVDDLKLRAQTLQRRVGLNMRRIDDQP